MTTEADELLSALPDGALLISSSGMVLAANEPALDILQTNAAGLTATSVMRHPSFADALAVARQSNRPVNFKAEIYARPPRQISFHIAPTGAHGAILVLLRDLTREQAIEKMRADFIANASHELRTPLTSILASIETLQGAARNDPKASATFLAGMFTQGQRMRRLIDDLLILSRIEINEHVKPRAITSLINIAQQAKANLAVAAEIAKVTVDIKGDTKIEVAGDADELLQVALNLLENAVKYGGAGGLIEIECTSDDVHGILAVRDFGQGIADHHLPRLTERFYRVSSQESRSLGGTGLGLAIVKHIVLRHRGKLAIRSAKGEGSTFTVSIPLAKS
jgi:two-component system, OmpR family, phosphate regulon sensor histidine kinase PhoR